MLSYKLQSSRKQKLLEGEDENIAFCRKILVSVSRSFAAVIQALPESLILDICIFYLVLRALDTVEDDMEVQADRKRQLLTTFVDTALTDPQWNLTGIGAGDERLLLEEFPKVHAVYQSLPEESQTVIADITQRMADGMCEFVGADLLQGTQDVEQYNLYCHYVAGLVGEGLSRLFAASKFEDASLAQQLELSNSMGLFLQKTNIIRDFLEDYVDQRAFWPKTVWKKYGSSLGDFTMEKNRDQAVACLNELCTDALELVPDCIAYMSRLRNPAVFSFCAIPQVMAIATLSKCYNNPDVFTGVVKIRRGLSCHMMMHCGDVAALHAIFDQFARNIRGRCAVTDPNYSRTLGACHKIVQLTDAAVAPRRQSAGRLRWAVAAAGVSAVAAWTMDPEAITAVLRHSLFPPVLISVGSLLFLRPLIGGGKSSNQQPKKTAA